MSRTIFRWLRLPALLLLLGTAAFAQQTRHLPMGVEITGQVRQVAGGAPIERALVRAEPVSGGLAGQTMTDSTGKFQLAGIAPAIYNVTVKAPGFKDYHQQVDLSTMTRSYLQVQLAAEADNTGLLALPTKTINAAVPPEAQKEYEAGRKDLLEAKNILTGILHLEKAVNLYPKFSEALLLLGTAYADGQQWQKAENTLKKLMEMDAKLTATYFTLGDAYRRQKKFDEAEKTLHEGLKLEPKAAQGHFNLGRVYFDKGDLAKAGPEIGQALQLKPDFAEAYVVAGNLFLRARRAEHALQMFEQYLKLEPKGQFASQAKEMVEKIKQALAEKK
jgi:tetratricopeptide (TPR) repeat protein